MTGSDAEIGRQLAEWGTVALLETRGRVSGRAARAAVGYIDERDGSLLVAAGDPDAAWARNLEADGRCVVTVGEREGEFLAEPLVGPDRNRAIAGLILRYGTPAEGLGRGPVFRLRPVDPGAAAADVAPADPDPDAAPGPDAGPRVDPGQPS
jgi:deazaflavin-dependent oxidoreductase (nitroreductase family)